MHQPYRVFQILPAPLDGRVYLIVDGTGDPATVLQKVLFHLAAPKASDPFRLEPHTIYQHIWDGALTEALNALQKEGLDGSNCEAYSTISNLRFECDSPSSSSQSSSSPSSSSDVEPAPAQDSFYDEKARALGISRDEAKLLYYRKAAVNPDVAPPPGSYHGLERKEMGGDPMAHRPPTPPSDQK